MIRPLTDGGDGAESILEHPECDKTFIEVGESKELAANERRGCIVAVCEGKAREEVAECADDWVYVVC